MENMLKGFIQCKIYIQFKYTYYPNFKEKLIIFIRIYLKFTKKGKQSTKKTNKNRITSETNRKSEIIKKGEKNKKWIKQKTKWKIYQSVLI